MKVSNKRKNARCCIFIDPKADGESCASLRQRTSRSKKRSDSSKSSKTKASSKSAGRGSSSSSKKAVLIKPKISALKLKHSSAKTPIRRARNTKTPKKSSPKKTTTTRKAKKRSKSASGSGRSATKKSRKSTPKPASKSEKSKEGGSKSYCGVEEIPVHLRPCCQGTRKPKVASAKRRPAQPTPSTRVCYDRKVGSPVWKARLRPKICPPPNNNSNVRLRKRAKHLGLALKASRPSGGGGGGHFAGCRKVFPAQSVVRARKPRANATEVRDQPADRDNTPLAETELPEYTLAMDMRQPDLNTNNASDELLVDCPGQLEQLTEFENNDLEMLELISSEYFESLSSNDQFDFNSIE